MNPKIKMIIYIAILAVVLLVFRYVTGHKDGSFIPK